jgi:hypothetical protein
MDDNSINQDGANNYQSSARGKKSRSKIVVNHNYANSAGSDIKVEPGRVLPGTSKTFIAISTAGSLATVAGLGLSILGLFQQTDPASGLSATLWISLALVCVGLIALAFGVHFYRVIRKSLISLFPIHWIPGIAGIDGRLRAVKVTGSCPIDGRPLRFRSGVQTVKEIPDGNGGVRTVAASHGPIGVCTGDSRHQISLTSVLRFVED